MVTRSTQIAASQREAEGTAVPTPGRGLWYPCVEEATLDDLYPQIDRKCLVQWLARRGYGRALLIGQGRRKFW